MRVAQSVPGYGVPPILNAALGTKMMTRKELMRMMPANADDMAAAERIIEMGYPEIVPVMRDMVNTMRVAESPVADVFAAYFGRLGQAAVQAIGQGLMKENCWLRLRIFTVVLPAGAVVCLADPRIRWRAGPSASAAIRRRSCPRMPPSRTPSRPHSTAARGRASWPSASGMPA